MKKYLYVLTRTMLGGASNSFSRLVINTLPLYPFVFIRHFFITILTLFIYKKENQFKDDFAIIKEDKKLFKQIIISAAISGLGTILFYNALKLLPVSLVSIFENGVYMIFTVILSVIFLKEKLPKNAYIYLTLCLVGLTLMITKGSLEIPDLSLIGFLLLTANALISAISSTITASTLKKISATTNTAIKSSTAAIVALIMVFVVGESFSGILTLLTIPLTFFLVYSVFSGFFIKYLQSRSVQELGSSKTAIFLLLTPIFSSLLGMIIFQEWFNLYQYIGLGLIVISILKLK